MAPCQVHPIIIHTNNSASMVVNVRTLPTAAVRPPIGGVRRNLFGQPDQREMIRQFDNENARQRKRLENYKIIEPITQMKDNSKKSVSIRNGDVDDGDDNDANANANAKTDKSSILPDLIAKELEAHEKLLRKEKTTIKNSNNKNDELDEEDSVKKRQEQIEKTPTSMATKTKLRTIHHIVHRSNSNTKLDVTLNNSEIARYKPYTKQSLITDAMPKRKSIPPP